MLELKNIEYEVENKQILKNINLKFEKNKTYVITGSNGSGKSTLAKIIMGIFPANGEIWFDGQNISGLSLSERAQLGFSIAFQQPVQFKGLTVRKLLEIATKKSGINDFCEILSSVGLCAREYLDREFNNQLSGGERKRIELALTLARGGVVNIFDEPEAGIDLWSFDNLTNLFNKQKTDKINIIISHQEKIIGLADQIIVLNNGEIQNIISKQDINNFLVSNTCSKLKGGN